MDFFYVLFFFQNEYHQQNERAEDKVNYSSDQKFLATGAVRQSISKEIDFMRLPIFYGNDHLFSLLNIKVIFQT